MTRIVLLLIVITCFSLSAAWIAEEPGRVAIDWGDYHIETSVLVMLGGTALAALACLIVYFVVFSVLRSPQNWLRSRLARRQQLGLEALTGTFAAIATQDIRGARKQIRRAQQYLPHQPLTLMLASQVARLEGNESQSRLYLEQMLKAGSTEFMALRGLIENARRSHDDDAALMHAEKALALKPQDGWLITALAGLYVKKQRTDDALRLVERGARKGALTRHERKALTAGILYECAGPLLDQQRYDLAVPTLSEALRYQPGFTPASAQLADAYFRQGDTGRALKVIASAWKIAPHPLLTQAMLRFYEPTETRKKVIRTAEKMSHAHPDHPETRMLLATLALKEGEAEKARGELQMLAGTHETVRACTLMAEAESALGDSAQSSQWMKRSHTAPAAPGFVCDNCRQPSENWHLSCPHCGGVASLTFK